LEKKILKIGFSSRQNIFPLTFSLVSFSSKWIGLFFHGKTHMEWEEKKFKLTRKESAKWQKKELSFHSLIFIHVPHYLNLFPTLSKNTLKPTLWAIVFYHIQLTPSFLELNLRLGFHT
jgi:hypothetical protein